MVALSGDMEYNVSGFFTYNKETKRKISMDLHMNHKLRIALLILVWVGITIAITMGAIWYGLGRSVESADRTIHAALSETKRMVPQLLEDESFIRSNYESTRSGLSEMVAILQDHGLEEAVPSKAHMEEYARLLDAKWLAVKDPDGNVLVSVGKEKKGIMQRLEDPGETDELPSTDWLTTSHALTSAKEDMTLIVSELAEGNWLFCQVSNEYVNRVEANTFSWITTMQNLKLTDDAYFIVISQTDDTVLVHPDKKVVGKTMEELGYASMDEYLKRFQPPDKDGIAMQKKDGLGLSRLLQEDPGGLKIDGCNCGFINVDGLYIFCTVPVKTSLLYILQECGVLFLFWIGTLLVLCYIIFHFGDVKHGRKRESSHFAGLDVEGLMSVGNGKEPLGHRFGFWYDRGWSRRLIFCCIIVLVGMLVVSVHMQLLSNDAQKRIQKDQMQTLTAELKKQSDRQKEELNNWYNSCNTQTAKVVTYVVTRDRSLQTRSAVKEIARRMSIEDIFLFDQKGRMRATNTVYDHLDLHQIENSRMARTFLPLLDGQKSAASTPYTENGLSEEAGKAGKAGDAGNAEDAGSAQGFSELDVIYNEAARDDLVLAYAGVSIRDERDLCDGCAAVAQFTLLELLNDKMSVQDMYQDILKMVKGTNREEYLVLSGSQIRMICYLTGFTALCLLLFIAIGTLRRDGWQDAPTFVGDGGDGGDDGSGSQRPDEPRFAGGGGSYGGGRVGGQRPEKDRTYMEWLDALSGQKGTHFFDRWKNQAIPLRARTAERKLLFILRGILLVLFAVIVFTFLTKGAFLNEHSVFQNLVIGGWEKGLNLYAVTASAMIIIVCIVLCSLLHQLVFFIAWLSTPRGETICHLVYSVITYAAVLFGLYYCLTLFGVQTKTLLASAGILGIVVTFGAQKTIADILSGMFLIFEDAVHVGDWIQVGTQKGMVKSIGVRLTKIESYGVVTTINNAELTDLQNFSKGDARALLKCPLYLDYSNDIIYVSDVIEREMPVISESLREKGFSTSEVWCNGPREFQDTGIMLIFNVRCPSHQYCLAQMRLNAELLSMCARNHIKTAFPHTILDFGEGTGHVTVDAEQGGSEGGKK